MARAAVSAMPAWSALADWQADRPRIIEREAPAVASASSASHIQGVCVLCADERGFDADGASRGLREGLACSRCRCNARQRAAARVLFEALATPASARVYASEQASPFYVALRRRVGRLIGSEFRPGRSKRVRLTLWLLRHGVFAWLRDEDVTALRLGNATLDAVISLDVLEHVPDHRAALCEFARVLKPGGALVLTVPFYDDRADNARIAWFGGDGALEYAGAPEYHGDPLGGGVLCFHHFGWALLDELREAGFAQVEACRVFEAAYGVPQGQWVIRARR
jgi:SAM-dependent methyltransferase